MASCAAYRAGGRRKERNTQNDGVCLPKLLSEETRPGFPRDDRTPACPQEMMKEFLILLFLCVAFAPPVKLSLSQPMSFFLWILCPILKWNSEQVAV